MVEPLVMLAAAGVLGAMCNNVYANLQGKEGGDLKTGAKRVLLGALIGVAAGFLGLVGGADKASLLFVALAGYGGIDLVELVTGHKDEIKGALVGE